MRSWTLFFSAIFTSVTAVTSLVIPFCLLLNFYHGDLFVQASERNAQRGLEVMLYLTPVLMLMAFITFFFVFSLLKTPHKIFELQRFLKVIRVFAMVWFGLIFLFQFLDGRMAEIAESVCFGLISLSIISIPLLIGIWSGNYMYLMLIRRTLKGRKITALFTRKYKELQLPPL